MFKEMLPRASHDLHLAPPDITDRLNESISTLDLFIAHLRSELRESVTAG